MQSTKLFTAALGLMQPWYIREVRFDQVGSSPLDRELHLYLGHHARAQFEVDGFSYPVYDHQERTWRHLNFFEHTCYLHTSVIKRPRI